MSFELFQGPGRPEIHISRRGQIRINGPCRRQWFEGKFWAHLLVDQENGSVAIRPLAEAERGAYRILPAGAGARIIAPSFAQCPGVARLAGVSLQATWDETLGAVVIKRIPVVSSRKDNWL